MASEREACPVCWEARRGLVFGCGHATCVACGEKLAACPICRAAIGIYASAPTECQQQQQQQAGSGSMPLLQGSHRDTHPHLLSGSSRGEGGEKLEACPICGADIGIRIRI